MPIDTQINIAFGVLAFLAAQAFVGAGIVLFKFLRHPAASQVAEEDDSRGALPGHA